MDDYSVYALGWIEGALRRDPRTERVVDPTVLGDDPHFVVRLGGLTFKVSVRQFEEPF